MAGDRRTFLISGALEALGLAAISRRGQAQTAARGEATRSMPAAALTPSLSIELWPSGPPGGPRRASLASNAPIPGHAPGAPEPLRHIDRPRLDLYRPAHPDGSAVIICPGGGYFMLSVPGEGRDPAAKCVADGVSAFVLTYRLPGEGWAHPGDVPLQDLQRAIRLVRQRASEFAIDPARVGVMGFSAGGHLAATLATRHAERTYEAVDTADAQPTKPAFAALIYPMITLEAPFGYAPAVPLLLGAAPSAQQIRSRSNEQLVTADTAPCFLAHGFDDTLVPIENSMLMMQALRAAKVPCEAHFFQHASHGFGVGVPGENSALWPALFLEWIKTNGGAARGA